MELATETSEKGLGREKAFLLRFRHSPEWLALVAVLAALCIFFAIESPYFLSFGNALSILEEISVIGLMAIPGTMLIISGQFDLSVGSGAALCGVTLALLAPIYGIFIAVVATILVGLAIGLINGFFVSVVGVNSLITTLGMLSALGGLAHVLSNGQTMTLGNFGALGTARPIGDIPLSVIIFVVVAIAGGLIMRYTVFGRSLYAMGANSVAARLVGVRPKRVIFATFLASGLAISVSGLILVSRLGAASPNAGTGAELTVITAIVLGGASLHTGRGTIIGTCIGLAIIGVLNNGLVLMNISGFYQDVARGVLLILAVSFDQLRGHFSRI